MAEPAPDHPAVDDQPAVDGPYVEVASGVWVRAAAVTALEWVGGSATTVLVRTRAGEGYGSPWSAPELRAALRLAERCELFAGLELAARLAVLHRPVA